MLKKIMQFIILENIYFFKLIIIFFFFYIQQDSLKSLRHLKSHSVFIQKKKKTNWKIAHFVHEPYALDTSLSVHLSDY